MKIIVCIKQVPEKLIRNSQGENIVERNQGKLLMNELDRYALEAALRIKEHVSGEVVAISMGNIKAEAVLKEAIAIGADRGILLTDSIFAGSDTWATSYILSQAIRKLEGYDIILCGRQTSDGDTAQVGPQLAQKLNVELITNVSNIEVKKNKKICCRELVDGTYISRLAETPIVITVNRAIGEPRVPTIDGIIRAEQIQIERWSSKTIDIQRELCGLKGSPTKVKKVYQAQDLKRMPIEIEGSIEEKANEIIRLIQENLPVKKDIIENLPYIERTKVRYIDAKDKKSKEIWIFGEQKNGILKSVTWEIAGKSQELNAGGEFTISLVTAEDLTESDLKRALIYGVQNLYVLNIKKSYDVVQYADALVKIVELMDPEIFLFGATDFGRALAPWIASYLHTGITADCIDLQIQKGTSNLIQIRPAFSGNLIAEIICPNTRPQMATVRTGIWEKKASKKLNDTIEIFCVENIDNHEQTNQYLQIEPTEESNICNTAFIIEGGRGVKTREDFIRMEKIAKKFNGSIGGTRAAVDAKLVDYKYQIGQTGTIVRPKVCLCLGISGALEHMVGIKEAKIIIAVNTDECAPIFNYADYKVVAKAEDVLFQIWEEIKKKEEN